MEVSSIDDFADQWRLLCFAGGPGDFFFPPTTADFAIEK